MMATIGMFLLTVAAVVSLMASQMNERAETDSVAMISGYLTDVQNALSETATDYSIWNAPYEALRDGDIESFYENYGSGATAGDVMHILAIADGPIDGTLSWIEDGPDAPTLDLVPESVIEEMRHHVAEIELGSSQTHDFFELADGTLYAFSGTRIEPEDIDGHQAEDLALAVLGYQVGAEQLALLSERYLLVNATLSDTPGEDKASLPVFGPHGDVLTYITWDAPRPGNTVLRRIGIPLGLVILAFLAVTRVFTRMAKHNASQLVEEEARASAAARTDALTGLPNRFALNEKLREADEDDDPRMSVLFIDINGFKLVNDSVGHKGGDQLIRELADRLSNIDPTPPFLARAGGDEFTIITHGTDAERTALDLAERIKIDLLPEFRLMDRGFHVGVAIGYADRETHEIGGAELLRRADLAMYKAKGLGISEPIHYDPAIDSDAQKNRIVEEALHISLNTPEEFSVVYQPIVATNTDQMVKAEALARWRSDKIGCIDPDTFITVAEETGLMVALGRILFLKICDDLVQWPELHVSINISPAQLNDGTFVRDTIRTLAERGIDPSRIEIEITEGLVVSNVDMAAYKLDLLHEAGFRTSLDDFGTGFSSIGYLKQLPFDTLKIDKSFAADVVDDLQAFGMLNAMVMMGQSLGKTVVCEGVETIEQVDILRNLECDLIQGYFYSRPLPLADLKKWDLATHSEANKSA